MLKFFVRVTLVSMKQSYDWNSSFADMNTGKISSIHVYMADC